MGRTQPLQPGCHLGYRGTGTLLAFLLGWTIFPLDVHADRLFMGRILRIMDGDTIQVDWDGKKQEVRLEGIDCPERGQAYGSAAKAETSRLALRQFAQIEIRSVDHLGRLVARVRVAGTDLSLALLHAGLAWHFKRYSSDATLAAAEDEAHQTRRGLWQDANPVPPWAWRHGTRDLSVPSLPQEAGVVHGNTKSNVFHRAACPQFNCKNCTAVFRSAKEAETAGFRPAGCCNDRRLPE